KACRIEQAAAQLTHTFLLLATHKFCGRTEIVMATQAQIQANRRNAQKSTGPRTAEGKAAVAKNATQHGLFARDSVVISENQAQFDALREEMFAELSPAGAMEVILANRIVSLTWRLRRAAQMQDEVIDVKIRAAINRSKPILSKSLINGQPCRLSKNTKRCYDDLALGLIAKWDFEGDRVLERLSMYSTGRLTAERRFEASLFRTMGELKKLQQARKRETSESIETEVVSYRGQDARITRGRDARDTKCAKQSQFAGSENELSAFEKKEYELLLRAAPVPNETNDLPLRTESRLLRQAPQVVKSGVGGCRY
ncbi:MAG: hypothetical protein JXM79_07375, partial [Sedimentisphaerales bacterium]|nr:hypothetical protein [Sedimentisphaerales bacterium]